MFMTFCHFHVGVSLLIMALWLPFESTLSPDLMRRKHPREENKFNLISGRKAWEGKLKNEVRCLCALGWDPKESAC